MDIDTKLKFGVVDARLEEIEKISYSNHVWKRSVFLIVTIVAIFCGSCLAANVVKISQDARNPCVSSTTLVSRTEENTTIACSHKDQTMRTFLDSEKKTVLVNCECD